MALPVQSLVPLLLLVLVIGTDCVTVVSQKLCHASCVTAVSHGLCQGCVTASPGTGHVQDAAQESLRQVHVLFRHGQRAPVRPYSLDPNNGGEHWPNGYGQLTQEGLQQHQRLGQWFRARYYRLLAPHWSPRQLSVFSTSVDRTLNSAQANLQGLYQGMEPERRFDATLDWSPVPVKTAPPGADKLLHVDLACPRVALEVARVASLPEVAALTRRCSPLFKLLTEQLGTTIDNLKGVGEAYNYFSIQQEHNITLPAWVLPHLPFMKEVYGFTFELRAYTDELKLLRAGPLLKKILADMEAKTTGSAARARSSGVRDGGDTITNTTTTTTITTTNTITNTTTPNFFMYSAHDTTVAAHLQALGVYNHLSPPYAATVIHELHQGEDGYYVRLFYRNDTVLPGGTALPLTLPGCPTRCPLPQYRRLLQPRLPVNYDKQCRVEEGGAPGNAVAETVHRGLTTGDQVVVMLLTVNLVLTCLIMAQLTAGRHVGKQHIREMWQ